MTSKGPVITVSEARYERIARALRDQIRRGDLAPGDRLPTEKALQQQYDVSVTVTRAALAQLRGEGLIVSEQGKGSFVRRQREQLRMSASRYRRNAPVAPHRHEAQAGGWVDDFTADIRTTTASSTVADRLQIAEGEQVSEAEYLRTVDGEPVQISTQWEPLTLTRGTRAEVPGGGELGAPDVITRMGWIGHDVTQVSEVIRSRMPSPDEVRTLDIPAGTPVLVIQRTHWSATRPVETADIVIRADRLAINNTITVQDSDEREVLVTETSSTPEKQPVVAAIVTSSRGVLAGRRNDGKPPWTFIAGEIEPGEAQADAAVREVKEETGLLVIAGDREIGRRVHPKTGRTMIYLACAPTNGTDVFVGDEEELAEVRWLSLTEADELMPGMFEPVHDHLIRTIGQ